MFFTFALGLGLPYLALATLSGSLPKLPRSGEWLRWVERLFGFVLVGMALYFIDPLLPKQASRLFFLAFFILAGIYLGFIEGSGRNLRLFPWLKRSVGVVALALAIWPFVPGQAAVAIRWQPFSSGLLEEARQQGKPVVVDVRADWCLPCEEMDRTTFVDPQIVKKTQGFVMLQADVTRSTPEVAARVRELEIMGVPTTLFIDGRGKERKRLIGYVGPERFLAEVAAVEEET
jgi:thiol:disulfide interchange protein DsbD